jgi:hypothetical protein
MSSTCLPCLIIHLIIQTIRRDPSGPNGIDEAPNVSRSDPSGADQVDAEHQPTDLMVAFSSAGCLWSGIASLPFEPLLSCGFGGWSAAVLLASGWPVVARNPVLQLTLDTSSVIHGTQAQPYGPQIDELVQLARDGRVGLWITTAFANDQERAPTDKHQRNLAWLRERPFIGRYEVHSAWATRGWASTPCSSARSKRPWP